MGIELRSSFKVQLGVSYLQAEKEIQRMKYTNSTLRNKYYIFLLLLMKSSFIYLSQLKLQGEKTGRKGHLSVATEVDFSFSLRNIFLPKQSFISIKSDSTALPDF